MTTDIHGAGRRVKASGGEHPLAGMLSARLAEVALMPLADMLPVLRAWGLRPLMQPDGTLVIETLRGEEVVHRTALREELDPTTRAVCLGFAIGGSLWPMVFPGLLDLVNLEWKRRQQAETSRLLAAFQKGEQAECSVPIAAAV